jgi:hypothetical protein
MKMHPNGRFVSKFIVVKISNHKLAIFMYYCKIFC